MTIGRSVCPWLLAAILPAQSEVARDLTSDDPRHVARAAALARGLTDRESRTALPAALERWTRGPLADAEHSLLVRTFVLDALVGREAKVPGDLLERLLADPQTEPAAFVLLCRSAREHERKLFALVREGKLDRLRYIAAGNVLAANGAAGFAAWIWNEEPLVLRLVVRSPGDTSSLYRPFPETAFVNPAAEPGFPDVPAYVLGTDAAPTGNANVPPLLRPPETWAPFEVFAPGAPNIGFARIAGARGGASSTVQYRGVRRRVEHGWLQRMAGVPVDATVATVEFTTPEAFQAAAARAREAAAAHALALRASLLEHGALTAREAEGCGVDVGLVVVDQRSDRRAELPDVGRR